MKYYYMVAFNSVYLYKALKTDNVRFNGYREIPEFAYNICISDVRTYGDFSLKVLGAS